MYEQVIELIQFNLFLVVISFGDNFVICIVKIGIKTAEEAAHRNIDHRMAVVGRRIDKTGCAICSNEVVPSPQVAVKKRRRYGAENAVEEGDGSFFRRNLLSGKQPFRNRRTKLRKDAFVPIKLRPVGVGLVALGQATNKIIGWESELTGCASVQSGELPAEPLEIGCIGAFALHKIHE